MRMCTVATTPLLMNMRIDAMKVAAAVLRACKCRETVSLHYFKGGFNAPLDPPLAR